MNTKKTLLTVVVLIVVLVGWMFLRNKGSVEVSSPTPTISPTEKTTPVVTNNPSPTATPASSNIVIYTDSGYAANTITIKKGETVTWKNNSKFSMWTASAVHPTHKAYPGTNIALCGTNTLVAIFDACKGYDSGDSWSFKFDSVGTWGYHNHSNSSHWGKVVVE